MSAPTAAQSEREALMSDLQCARCGYNLVNSRGDENCPECSHPVSQSIEFATAGGRKKFLTRRIQIGAALLFAVLCILADIPPAWLTFDYGWSMLAAANRLTWAQPAGVLIACGIPLLLVILGGWLLQPNEILSWQAFGLGTLRSRLRLYFMWQLVFLIVCAAALMVISLIASCI